MKKFSIVIIIVVCFISINVFGRTIELESKNTISVVEVNEGDEIIYKLQTGRLVKLKIIKTNSEIIFSTIDLPGEGSVTDASVYKMKCWINIDGQDLEMKRYVPVQESFYEPYSVNGLRIWFDALESISQFYNENHGSCLPNKQVRLVLHDASLPICPEEVTSWCNLTDDFPNVKHCFRGEDTWLGTFFGTDLHGGLDINMPSNSQLRAPFSLDFNYTFNSLISGHNNNRWRAHKYWDNGDIWTIQTHHHNELIVPEFKEIQKGTKYAYSAGTLAGHHTHTHFVFKVKQSGFNEFLIDPWIIFWQILENNKKKSNAINAQIEPISPGETGVPIQFDGNNSSSGSSSATPDFYWSFGDGGFSISQRPIYVFQKPGIYPITLTIFDGLKYSSTTQHITINGNPQFLPEYRVRQKNNNSFVSRNPSVMDSYNNNELSLPNTISFSLPHLYKDKIKPQKISLKFNNYGNYYGDHSSQRIEIKYVHGNNWLDFEKENTSRDDSIIINIIPKIEFLNTQEGKSEAYLVIHEDGFINSPSLIRVEIDFNRPENKSIVIIDNNDPECNKSNYFWLTNKLNSELDLHWSKCFGESFLMNSENFDGGYIRYSPKLKEGKYRVSLYSPLYSQEIILNKIEGFYVNINSSDGYEKRWIDLSKSTTVGEYNFNNCEGYVEIISDESQGLIIADAIKFEKIN